MSIPEDMPLWTSWMAEAADEGTAVCDFRLQRKDGEVAWVEAAAAAAACGTARRHPATSPSARRRRPMPNV